MLVEAEDSPPRQRNESASATTPIQGALPCKRDRAMDGSSRSEEDRETYTRRRIAEIDGYVQSCKEAEIRKAEARKRHLQALLAPFAPPGAYSSSKPSSSTDSYSTGTVPLPP